jgi:signal transduction histidine kinase
LRCRGTPTVLDTECSTALFRIFQEMMANVARHAEASEVQITLTVSRTSARLEVQDNGKGMAADPASPGLGLLGMQERATALGGRLELSSEFSRGTKVQAWIPLTGRRTLVAFSGARHRS